jgi:hypothetical protein
VKLVVATFAFFASLASIASCVASAPRVTELARAQTFDSAVASLPLDDADLSIADVPDTHCHFEYQTPPPPPPRLADWPTTSEEIGIAKDGCVGAPACPFAPARPCVLSEGEIEWLVQHGLASRCTSDPPPLFDDFGKVRPRRIRVPATILVERGRDRFAFNADTHTIVASWSEGGAVTAATCRGPKSFVATTCQRKLIPDEKVLAPIVVCDD